jgi:flagellar operon protein
MQQRGIELKPEQLAKLSSAIDKAAAKGAKESLVLMDSMAMIVNVKSKTIVTAIDGDAMRDNLFTQIDSAVIL